MSRRQESEQLKKCVEYFRQNSVWEKVLNGFFEKYASYGRFSGSVRVQSLSPEELEGFFGKSFHRQKSVTISAEKFQKVLENSRYKGLAPEEILESYFGKALCSKQEERILKAQKQQELLLRMSSEYEGTPAQVELEYFMQMLKGNSREDFEELEQQLKLSAEIFNKVPYRKTQKIYLAVFAAMLCGKEEYSCMCMNGQPRLASLMLLDLLAESGTTVYYSGDLDPEGLLIAQKLADYYKGTFYFWHMESEDYEQCRSSEVISDRRMKSLDKITDARLIPVVDQIKKYKTAGYQERLFIS